MSPESPEPPARPEPPPVRRPPRGLASAMTGDFSRVLQERGKRYRGVQMQQGRVQLDADWNAQGELAARRMDAAIADVVGENGAPHGDAGYAISTRPGLRFDGRDDYAYTPRPPAPREGGYALAAWVSPQPGSAGGTVAGRYAEGDGQRDAAILAVDAKGIVSFRRSGQASLELRGERPIPFGRPSHLAVVAGDQETVLYVDGVVAARKAQGFPLPQLPATLFFGAALLDRHLHLCLAGILYDVRWWGSALDAGRIQAAMRPVPDGALEDDLLAWWPMDERDGDRAADRTGRGHDATLGAGVSRPAPAVAGISIGAGRYYVGGVLCENAAEVPFTAQPDLPGAMLPPQGGLCLAYLDVWERFVTAVEDPDLREVALGGPTTTTRTQALAQVKLLTIDLDRDAALGADWEARLAPPARGSLRARRQLPPRTTLGNQLYRLEIHTSGAASRAAGDGGAGSGVVAARPLAGTELEVPAGAITGWAAGDRVEVWSDVSQAAGRKRLAAGLAAVDPARGRLTLDTDVGSLVGDLKLCRVATCKWSRNNGSLTYAVSGVDGSTVKVQSREGRIALPPGSWVEMVDDPTTLSGASGPLLQVSTVHQDTSEVVFATPPPAGMGTDPALHPLLRPWDQTEQPGSPLAAGAVPVRAASWIDLEAGVQVWFDGDSEYRAGDYWWMPARTLTEDIEWPRDADGRPLAEPPVGIEHRLAPLALIDLDSGEVWDRRRTFQPLVTGAVSKLGDTMYGSLDIQAGLSVEREIRGDVYFGRLGSPYVVGTDQLQDRAVTPPKLAEEVGTVPPGYSILGGSEEPPPGYVWTRASLAFANADPRWRALGALPREHAGAVAAVAAVGRIYAILEIGEVWELDPADGSTTLVSRLPDSRRAFAAAALDGRIYVVGGVDAAGTRSARTDEYDPVAERWTRRADMPTARDSLAAAAAEGRLHALGGTQAGRRDAPLAAHESYDPATDAWSACRPLPTPRYGLAAAALQGALHTAGGERGVLAGFGRTITGIHEVYQPATDSWRRRAPLLFPRRGMAMAALGGKLYGVGGEGPLGGGNSNQIWDAASGTWYEGTTLPEAAPAPGAAADSGRLYLFGGRRGASPSVPIHELPVSTIFYVHRKLAPGEAAPERSAGT